MLPPDKVKYLVFHLFNTFHLPLFSFKLPKKKRFSFYLDKDFVKIRLTPSIAGSPSLSNFSNLLGTVHIKHPQCPLAASNSNISNTLQSLNSSTKQS